VTNRSPADADAGPILRFEKVSKAYQGLRPLRLASLHVLPGERVALAGVDAPGAEVLVNLVTGAAVPDQGEVWTLGRRTADISSADEWLAWLDFFGIVSERSVLLEGSSLEQNLAMPFTLEIDPIPLDVMERVRALARECGLPGALFRVPAAQLPPDARIRAHLARAIALSPRLLLIEHPTGRVSADSRASLASDVVSVCEKRQLTALILTNDDAFARGVATRHVKLDGATGELRPIKKGWFGATSLLS
jgi:ABC-type lipoprotein export system ATPase subunit